MRTIYWAAPLHDATDQARNEKYVKLLRTAGHSVYVPQEHGIWEDLVSKGATREEVRAHLYKLDLNAMRNCDTCIACCGDLKTPRGPSEGMMWEMGWMKGNNKTVILFNEDFYWDYNLMPQFGADFYCKSFDEVLNILTSEEPK